MHLAQYLGFCPVSEGGRFKEFERADLLQV